MLDIVYTYRFLRMLSMKWEDTDAYKLGIIDENGNALKKSSELKTSKEKKAYTSFIRLVFKFKKMLSAVPGGKSVVARYGAALALLKENKEEVEQMGLNLSIIKKYLKEEVSNTTGGVEEKEQPLGEKGKICKKKKKKEETSNPDEIKTNESLVGILFLEDGGVLLEKRRVIKRRIRNGKRIKRREVVSPRFTRTGRRKLRGGAKTIFKHKHKKAYRKAHTASANAKRRRSMRKRKSYSM